MVKYFDELENPRSYSLPLVDCEKEIVIEVDPVPMEFFSKYGSLLLKLRNIDLLKEGKEKQVYTSPRTVEKKTQEQLDWGDVQEEEIDYETLARYCTSKNYMLTPEDFMQIGFTYYGALKILTLMKEYERTYIGKDYEKAYTKYIYSIFSLLDKDKQILSTDRFSLISYLDSALTALRCQNRLDEDLKKEALEAINYLEGLRVVLREEREGLIYFKLPNAWYITPYEHLYNTMGPNGHGEANLNHPIRNLKYGKELYGHYGIKDYNSYLESINDNIRDGYITGMEYFEFLHMRYKLPGLNDERYYSVNSNRDLFCHDFEIKSYNKRIVNTIIGIKSAHAGLYKFYDFLYEHSCDYEADLKLLEEYTIDDILVRCCGFHKISSVIDQTITTTSANYEKEFAEYIARGWHVDYIRPFVFNTNTKRLEEMDDYLYTTVSLHRFI